MNYSIFTDELSKRAGIHKELFELSEKKTGKKIQEDNEYKVLEKHNIIKNHFYNDYQYKENYKQGWKSITFSIPTDIAHEFFGIVNSILEENNENSIDLDNIKNEIVYNNDGIISLLILKQKGFYQVEIANRN
ncbi:hypothetical protein SLW70_07395 [Flavobacterium sp. NG2]|uniref:hypothetical protein n=1 Tax=Flavobacterium sp. NG2 TaxID=3097547 RepID=UPI002A81C57A|nr:hypothetical protein [Flavobacterium sp. NG2]WPR72935.1 hypothetical protein SLW70_07395 [Flavobacterium sp. NG2]